MSGIELVLSIVGGIIFIQLQLIGMVKWLVKHYLNELVPNSGSSLKDQITRLEARQQEIFLHMLRNDRS
jgi:hypothetical protein